MMILVSVFFMTAELKAKQAVIRVSTFGLLRSNGRRNKFYRVRLSLFMVAMKRGVLSEVRIYFLLTLATIKMAPFSFRFHHTDNVACPTTSKQFACSWRSKDPLPSTSST